MADEDDSSDDEHFDTDTLIRNFEEEAKLLRDNLLPQKSKDKYLKEYEAFMKWKNDNKASFDQDVFLVYFHELSEHRKPPTLWSVWSKLKATLHLKQNVDIDKYIDLKGFLKSKNKGYKPKKSKTLTLENINKFIELTTDAEFLSLKVCIHCICLLYLKNIHQCIYYDLLFIMPGCHYCWFLWMSSMSRYTQLEI